MISPTTTNSSFNPEGFLQSSGSLNAYQTEQEAFWAGEFGDEYIQRNQNDSIIAPNISLFSRILGSTQKVNSIVELGCNIGLNLQALNILNRNFELYGYEINEAAAKKAQELNIATIHHNTIINEIENLQCDLSFTKGVLIHINPDELSKVYQNLYNASNRYILVCEYYNPTPVTISYRGEQERLFKRDFAGELIDKYKLKLIDYGFVYHRDNNFPQDDLTWFLLEK